MIKVDDYDAMGEIYYADISQRRYQKYENKSLEQLYHDKFESTLGVDLETLLCGSFDVIKSIALPLSIESDIKEIFDYQGKFQKHISELFKKYLDIHTCYYCNIDFVNVFKTGNKNSKSGYTLDHIKDKSSYPHLALSLYNLIPSCYVCNSKLKRDQNIGGVSPTSEVFDFDDKVTFKTFMQNSNLQIDSEEDFELLLKEDFSDIYQKYIEVFELNGRYAYHKYKVLELIKKRRNYPDSRIKELAKISQKTEEEVKKDIFGKYLPSALHKRSLSKLIKDITKELDI